MDMSGSVESVAIAVSHISKAYKLYPTPVDRLLEAIHPFGKRYHENFYALHDVSFTVPKGETLGIVGANGAGKSTLLKIITGVVAPSEGHVQVNGKVSALLELGAGFNPELTGLENVYLNGILNGLSKREIDQQLEAILTFANIGNFIHQPVRVYSSGMFVRLAFAAAITVDPDILIVDEALAVGDIHFQHKCYSKFLDFKNSSKTVIFVSHNLELVNKYCTSAIYIRNGELVAQGNPQYITGLHIESLHSKRRDATAPQITEGADSRKPEGTVDDYLASKPDMDLCATRVSYNPDCTRHGTLEAEVRDAVLASAHQFDAKVFEHGEEITLFVKVVFHKPVRDVHFGFALYSLDGVLVYGSQSMWLSDENVVNVEEPESMYLVKFTIRQLLNSGDYFVNLGCGCFEGADPVALDLRSRLLHFKVVNAPTFTGHSRMSTGYAITPLN